MKYLKLTYILLALLLIAQISSAQHGHQNNDTQIEALRVALEQTDQILEQALEAVRASGSPTTKMYFEQAQNLQRNAWNSFRENTQSGYQRAKMQTEQAREMAQKAVATYRSTDENNDSVLRKLEQLKESLEQTRGMNGNTMSGPRRALYESAQNNLRLAWEFYRQGQFRASIKLCEQVENITKSLLNYSNTDNRQKLYYEHNAENFEAVYGKYKELIAECNLQQSKTIFEQAEQRYQQANQLAQDGSYQPAVKNLNQAKRLIQKAIDRCSGINNFEIKFEKILSEANRIKENLNLSDEIISKQLEQVYVQLENARSFIDNSQNNRATVALKAAQLTLRKIKQQIEKSPF